jgi:hypothetical protein
MKHSEQNGHAVSAVTTVVIPCECGRLHQYVATTFPSGSEKLAATCPCGIPYEVEAPPASAVVRVRGVDLT